jgi:serine/threonine protein kinase
MQEANRGGKIIDGILFHDTNHFENTYNIKDVLGHGSFGTVFACTNRIEKADCAVKRISIKDGITESGGLSKRLENTLEEVEILVQLRHKNVVQYYTSFLQWRKDVPKAPNLYVQMELMRMSLSDFLRGRYRRRHYNLDDNSVDGRQALQMFLGLMDGLSHIHDRSFVHLDLKPDNVLIDDEGTVKIADFGLSQYLVDGETISKGGTRAYSSPEQLAQSLCSAKSDVYSAAFMLAELMVPCLAFESVRPILSQCSNKYLCYCCFLD